MSPHRALSTLFALVALSLVLVGTVGHLVTRGRTEIDLAREDARRTAESAARLLVALRDLPRVIDDAITDQLTAQTALVDVMTAMGEGLRGDALNNRLAAAASSGGPIGILVTDAGGRVLFRSKPALDVAPGPDGAPPPHARAIGALIAGASSPVTTPAERVRGGPVTRQAAERGGKGRLVQITADVTRVDRAFEAIAPARLLETAIGPNDAATVLFPDGRAEARVERPGAPAGEVDGASLRRVASSRTTEVSVENDVIVAAAPVSYSDGTTAVVTIMRPAPGGRAAWGAAVAIGGVALACLIWPALLLSARLARGFDRPLEELAEASAALAVGRFNPFTLNEGRERPGPAGSAARAFVDMARVVGDREDALEAKLVMMGRDPRA